MLARAGRAAPVSVVALTEQEMLLACQHAAARYVAAVSRRARGTEGAAQPPERTMTDFLGCMAELAACKARGLYWTGAAGLGAADAGPVDVRATEHAGGHLILHDADPDDRPFLLVVCRPPRFMLAGWLWGREGKSPRWWRTDVRQPAYFVPQSALRPAHPARRAAA